MSDKKHTIDELSALFDGINVGDNLNKSSDYGTQAQDTENLRSFDDRCKDIVSVLEPDMATESAVVEKVEPTPDSVDKKPHKELKQTVEDVPIVKQVDPVDSDNPLGLHGEDLRAFKDIKDKHPQFVLSDGGVAFKDFYRWKVRVLKSILSNFPILPLDEMREAVESTNVNHQVDNDVVDPELIRVKLDKAYSCRTYLTTMLAKAHAQNSLWKRSSELLCSKLWKDHESKGAHKRDALSLEHNYDIIGYYERLKGFIEGATIVDNLLKAASDSLSRQLSCITIREQTGLVVRDMSDETSNVIDSNMSVNNDLDSLDTIDIGVVIKEPISGGAFCEKDFGSSDVKADSDFLSGIG